MDNIVYLDNYSTTKIDPRVLEKMNDCFSVHYGNPSSIHYAGRTARALVNNAREKLSLLLNCQPSELFFTSGATESINLALKGIMLGNPLKGNHIITVQTEHRAVLETCKYLEQIGYDVTYLPVQADGLVDQSIFTSAIRSDTVLACVMLVNNETGVIQPIKNLAKIAHEKKILLMVDATQAMGKIPIDVDELGIDLLCISGHKFHGPKGCGLLFIKAVLQSIIKPQIHGGNQEKGFRSGTLNTPAIVGMSIAAQLACEEMDKSRIIIEELRNMLESTLTTFSGVEVNGSIKHRLYNITNISFKGFDAEDILMELDDVIVANGSSCTSELIEPSHVLTAMGLKREAAFSSIRISLSKFTTEDEIGYALKKFASILKRQEFYQSNN